MKTYSWDDVFHGGHDLEAEYVDSQVAQGLYEALELAMQSIDPNNHDVFDICNAALTKARGES